MKLYFLILDLFLSLFFIGYLFIIRVKNTCQYFLTICAKPECTFTSYISPVKKAIKTESVKKEVLYFYSILC